MADPTEDAEFWSKVDEFKGKADEFYTEWQRLRGMRQAAARDPEALAEWNRLMGQADGVQAKVSDVEQAIQDAKAWAGSLFGYNGAQMRNGMGDLGAWFVVALIAGAIAWLGTWLTDAYLLDRKLTYQENLINQGISPERAAATARDETNGGFFPAFGEGIGKGLILAAAVGLGLWFMLEKKRGF